MAGVRFHSLRNTVWVVQVDGGFPSAPEKQILNFGPNGFGSHALAHAPLATVPAGGRYLFGAGSSGLTLQLLDAHFNPITSTIPFDAGEPSGKSAQPDIAFGVVEGRQRFLVVWSDADNCKPPLTSCPPAP